MEPEKMSDELAFAPDPPRRTPPARGQWPFGPAWKIALIAAGCLLLALVGMAIWRAATADGPEYEFSRVEVALTVQQEPDAGGPRRQQVKVFTQSPVRVRFGRYYVEVQAGQSRALFPREQVVRVEGDPYVR